MTATQIVAISIGWTAATVAVTALISTRRQASRNQRDRDIARLARTHDLHIQSPDGRRLIQMTFAEILAHVVEQGDHTLTSNVWVYRRQPGVRVFDGQGNPEFERPAPRMDSEEYEALKTRW